MAALEKLRRYAGRRMIRRVTEAVPFVGAVIALAALGGAIRRKGWLGGTADTALDMVPFVGGAKAVAEIARGRDFIPDRRRPA